jgi:hypothetical protein
MEKRERKGFLGTLYELTRDQSVRDNPDRVETYIPPGIETKAVYYNAYDFKYPQLSKVFCNSPNYSSFICGDTPLMKITTNVKNGNAIICDIDGCAAHRCDRNWFEYDKVINDEPDFAVRNIVNAFYEKGYSVLFVSGREGTAICKELTQRWLNENGFKHHALYMRKEGDFRRDSIVKQEIYEQHIKDKYVVEFVLDDRDLVVSKWRELGLKCLQVQPGAF